MQMATRSETVEFSDTVIGVIVGAVTGGGGIAGLWAYLRAKMTDDGETMRQFYADISSRIESLEGQVRDHQTTIAAQNSTIAAQHVQIVELINDRDELRIERDTLSHEVHALQARLEELEARTSEVEDLAP